MLYHQKENERSEAMEERIISFKYEVSNEKRASLRKGGRVLGEKKEMHRGNFMIVFFNFTSILSSFYFKLVFKLVCYMVVEKCENAE
jgi:hypothetical protein